MSTQDFFTYTIYIDTTPEKLWQALTDGDFSHSYWAGRRLESDWKVGSPVQALREDGVLDWKGTVLEADPPKRLSYTFDVQPAKNKRDAEGNLVDDGSLQEPPSRVAFDITPHMGKVKLTLMHDQFPPDSLMLKGVSGGWPMLLSGLKYLLETGRTLFPDFR